MSRTPRVGLRTAVATAAAAPLLLTLAVGAGAATPPPGDVEQPELDARVKEIIEVDGLRFRDLNDNEQLDAYEDWRLPTDERVEDLVGQMELVEKSGLMLINTLNAACDPETGEFGVPPAQADNYLNTQHMHRFVFRNVVDVRASNECTGSGSPTVSPAEAANFTNAVQEMSEATRLGIPSLFKSNARNHIDPDARVGINEAAGAFSSFPKEAGIAAAALGEEARQTGEDPTTGDMSVVEDFADVMGDEWASIGLRGMYGYMADLATEPRWYRTHETFTEDAYLAADIMETLVTTLQGEELTDNGLALSPQTRVALTLKHFPGGGPQELGLDPHYAFGKAQVYPAEMFEEHFLPFQAAINAGVSSIMPYYGIPVDVPVVGGEEGETYPHTGFAFSDSIVNGLLRDQLGFTGYVNSDTGIINDRAWGLEENSVPERVAAAINGGTDTLSGFSNVSVITDLHDAGLITEERIDLAAERLLEPLFDMGLFENPYVDPAIATATVGSDENRAVGVDLQRKSLVLLQNEETDAGPVLPLEDGGDVYILGDFTEETVESYGYDVTDGNVEDGEERPSAEGSDYVLISMTARTNAGDYVSNDPELGLNPEYGPNPSVVLDEDGNPLPGLDGESLWGESDVCVHGLGDVENPRCTDNRLGFGGSYPWESSILDFTGMQEADSWEVVPSLDTIQQVMDEVDDPSKVILHVYFRQPYVLDEDSGLRDAGAILAGFGMTDGPLMDVLTGEYAPQGKMPFALAGTRDAIIEQDSDRPGYDETEDGALYPFGYGLTYGEEPEEPEEPEQPAQRYGFFLTNGWGGGDADHAFMYGRHTDEVLIGDWDGDGTDSITVRRGKTYFVNNHPRGGPAESVFHYGRENDVVLVGDWDADGVDTLAVRRDATYHVKNSLRGGPADQVITYGRAGDDVMVGDWDADGRDTFAVRREATYHVKNSVRGGDADVVFTYGRAGDEVLAGDWDGDGYDTFAVRRGKQYHVNNSLSGGPADRVMFYGRDTDEVYVGDWDGNGTDTIGVRRTPQS